MCTNDKPTQTFLQHLPVPVRHIVKSSGVVITPVFMLKKKKHTSMQISYKIVVQACQITS